MISNQVIWLPRGNGKKHNTSDMLVMLHSASDSGKTKYFKKNYFPNKQTKKNQQKTKNKPTPP